MSRARFPLFLLAVLALLAGLWAGLLRIGWPWPTLHISPAMHGPLMISGFLGTLISLERAVAARQRWPYLNAILSGAGSLLIVLGSQAQVGAALITLASAGLVLLFMQHLRLHRALHTAVMALGALLWLVGNLLWLAGRPIHLAVWWWAGFLVLTIAGERLELGRVLRQAVHVKILFGSATAVFLAGLLLTFLDYGWGVRLLGLGLLLLAAWLLKYDLARRNLRRPGLTGYIAACLFTGYIWLAAAGGLAMWYGPVSAGPIYDAILHAIFLGFAFGMIFGHAPIIFPAVLKRPMPFRPFFYAHLILLQISLLLRLVADLMAWPLARQWGGLLNALVVLLFLANMIAALISGARNSQPLPFSSQQSA